MFPLEGEYIFRFKIKIGNSVVWMDVKEDAKIPLFNGKIIMKATRVSWESKSYAHSSYNFYKEKEPKIEVLQKECVKKQDLLPQPPIPIMLLIKTKLIQVALQCHKTLDLIKVSPVRLELK